MNNNGVSSDGNPSSLGQELALANALQQQQNNQNMLSNSPDMHSQHLLQQQFFQQQLLRQQLLSQEQQRQLLMRQAMANQLNANGLNNNNVVQLTPQQQLLLRQQQKQQQIALQNQQLSQQLLAMSSQQQQQQVLGQQQLQNAQNLAQNAFVNHQAQLVDVTTEERVDVIGKLAQAAMLALPPQQQTEERANNLGMKLEEHIFGKATSRDNYFHIVETQLLWQKSSAGQQNQHTATLPNLTLATSQDTSTMAGGNPSNKDSPSANLFLGSTADSNAMNAGTPQDSSNLDLSKNQESSNNNKMIDQQQQQAHGSPISQPAKTDSVPSQLDIQVRQQQSAPENQADQNISSVFNNQLGVGAGQYIPLNLSDADKKLVIQSLQQISPLYTKIDIVIKMLFQFGGETQTENIKKLSSMKQILATQLEVVGRGVFLVLPDQLSKLHATLLRFFQYADQIGKQSQMQQLTGSSAQTGNTLALTGNSPRVAPGQPVATAMAGSPHSSSQSSVSATPIPASGPVGSPNVTSNHPIMSPNVRPSTPIGTGSPQVIPGMVGSPQITAQAVGGNPLIAQFQNLQVYVQQIQSQMIQLQQIRPTNAEQLLNLQRQHAFLQQKQLQAQQQASLIQMQLRTSIRPMRPNVPAQQPVNGLNPSNPMVNQQQLLNQLNQQRLMNLTPQQKQHLLLQQQQQQLLLLQQRNQILQQQQQQDTQQLLLNQNAGAQGTLNSADSPTSAGSPPSASANAAAKKAPRKRKPKDKASPKSTNPKSPSASSGLTPSIISAQSPPPTHVLDAASPIPSNMTNDPKASILPAQELESLFESRDVSSQSIEHHSENVQSIQHQQQQILLQQEIQRQMFLDSTNASNQEAVNSQILSNPQTTLQATPTSLALISESTTPAIASLSGPTNNEWNIFNHASDRIDVSEKPIMEHDKEDESIAMFFNLDYESPPASPPKSNILLPLVSSSTPSKSPLKREREEEDLTGDERRTKAKTYLSTPAEEQTLSRMASKTADDEVAASSLSSSCLIDEIQRVAVLHNFKYEITNLAEGTTGGGDDFLAGEFVPDMPSDRVELTFVCESPRLRFAIQLASKAKYERFYAENSKLIAEGTELNFLEIYSGIEGFTLAENDLESSTIASLHELVLAAGVGTSCKQSLSAIINLIMSECQK